MPPATPWSRTVRTARGRRGMVGVGTRMSAPPGSRTARTARGGRMGGGVGMHIIGDVKKGVGPKEAKGKGSAGYVKRPVTGNWYLVCAQAQT